jgi:hypothetical protein
MSVTHVAPKRANGPRMARRRQCARRRRVVLALCALLLGIIRPAGLAAQPSGGRGLLLGIPELTRSATLVVVGEVVAAHGEWDATWKTIWTRADFRVDEVLKGTAEPGFLQIVQPGGRVGDIRSSLGDAAALSVGERAVLFLSRRSDGVFRVAHFYMGKFSLEADVTPGTEVAVRRVPGSNDVLDRIPFNEVRRMVRDAVGP